MLSSVTVGYITFNLPFYLDGEIRLLGSCRVGCPIPNFSIQKGACVRPLCDCYAPWACTGASSTADLYPTVKAALRHESVDSEEDREGLGCHLGQGLEVAYAESHLSQKNQWFLL